MTLEIDPKETTTILKEFIKTYVKNSGCTHVILGLSGGIDSAVSAVLCVKALGKNKVTCFFMPDGVTPTDDTKHQQLLSKQFGIKCIPINISPIVNQVRTMCHIENDKLTVSNVKARIRMMILYAEANKSHSLVCGTSNKSELLVGYFTKYGDGGVDFHPLGDLYKTQVYQLANHLDIPQEIIKKPPTAGLWPGQTDEEELGVSYQILDQILYGLERKMEIHDIAQDLQIDQSVVKQVHQMRVCSQHKRRTPLIVKLGLRTVGTDWRTPVQEG